MLGEIHIYLGDDQKAESVRNSRIVFREAVQDTHGDEGEKEQSNSCLMSGKISGIFVRDRVFRRSTGSEPEECVICTKIERKGRFVVEHGFLGKP